jgi:hypothetical protein
MTDAAPKYDFDKDKNRCPACGGLGIPWHGWFTCEDCQAIALIQTGEVWVRLEDYNKLKTQLADVTAHRDKLMNLVDPES